jgi:hypothetical protein
MMRALVEETAVAWTMGWGSSSAAVGRAGAWEPSGAGPARALGSCSNVQRGSTAACMRSAEDRRV